MTDKIKIAASILDEETEIIQVPKKLKINKTINIENFKFLKDEDDSEEVNNIFFSILDKYKINSFDLFNLKEISKTLNINVNINKATNYDINLLLYRVATNLNTALLIKKTKEPNNNEIKLHLSDLENKFEYLMNDIEKINKKLERINKIKKKIVKENNIIKRYLSESDNLSLEKLKLEKIEMKIDKIKKSIFSKIIIINKYIDTKLTNKTNNKKGNE